MTETRDKIVIESTTQGVDQSTDKLKGLASAYDGVAVASEKTEKSTVSIENKFASLERRFQTTAGQQAQFEKIQNQVNLAVKQNPELQDRANSVLAAAEARYLGAGVAVKALAEAHKGLDAQGQAALHSVRSVVEQLALGIPPTQALTGQLNHLTFAATGEGGLVGAFKQVGGLIGGLITPTTAAIGATLALGAAAAALAVQYDKVQVSSQRALIGAGGRTGTTVGDLNTFTEQNSGLAGTGLSAKEARGLGEEFTQTGDIVISRLHGMSDAVVGFANQTGKSISEASKDMVGFASDPKKALDDLGKVFGTFDAATRKAVETFVLAGDKTGAFQAEIDAIADKSKKAADNMGFFEKATRAVVNALATETVKPSGVEDQLEKARAKLNTAIASAPDMLNPAEASQNIERLSREFEKLQQAREDAIGQTATEELNKLSTESSRSREQIAAIAKSWGDVGTATALALNALQNQLPVAQAITGAAQMTAQYYATINTLLLQGKTDLEAQAIAAKQYELAQASATAAVEKQTEALKDSNAMLKAQLNGTEKSTAAAIAYKNAIASGASEASAIALKTETARSYTIKAAAAALEWQQNLFGASKAAGDLADRLKTVTAYESGDAAFARIQAQQGANFGRGGDFGNFSVSGMDNQDQGHSFSADPRLNVSYKGGGAGQRLDVGQNLIQFQQLNQQVQDDAKKYMDQFKANNDYVKAMVALTKATDANTAATSATLNPLYSQGHGALAIGYYKAATGLEGIVGGSGGVDSTPIRVMATPGEHFKFTPPGQSSNNDNRAPAPQTTIIQNFDMRGVSTSNARRSQRQFAQGFGQIAAAGS